MISKISTMLDRIADSLEVKGLTQEAYEVDVVANSIDKAAVTQYPFKVPLIPYDDLDKMTGYDQTVADRKNMSYSLLSNSMGKILNTTSLVVAWTEALMAVLSKKGENVSAVLGKIPEIESRWLEFSHETSMFNVNLDKVEDFVKDVSDLYFDVISLVMTKAEYNKYGGYTYRYGDDVKEELDKVYPVEKISKECSWQWSPNDLKVVEKMKWHMNNALSVRPEDPLHYKAYSL